MDKNTKVGDTLKKLRKQKNLTLQALARETGISAGYISKIERESVNPSANNIQKLCYALGITANELMVANTGNKRLSDNKPYYVVRKSDHSMIYGITNALTFESVFEELPQFKVNTMKLVGNMKEQSYTVHTHDEFGIVARGQLTITLDDQYTYDLVEGDSILIRSNTKHSVTNRSTEECITYWIEVCS
ncbi:MAG: helix-turn-helix domain-containing protein [Planctomycetaceae bacterium]|nr:helix-turn-helix domain-containing protein [Planctomycetaceae bacterium]